MASRVLYPQSIVKVNGKKIDFISWNVENNLASTADAFSVVIAKIALDKHPSITNQYLFHTLDDIYVEIYFGFAPSPDSQLSEKDMKLMINGFVDKPRWQYAADTVTLTGRDKTSLFLESKVSGKFTNLTVEQLIRMLGAKRGLRVEIDPQVVGNTKKVGTIANGEQCLLIDNVTEWDLMSTLAREEGRELFVRGNTLFYRNPVAPRSLPSFKFAWGENLSDLEIDRTIKNTKSISVTVRSWNRQMKRRNEYTAVAGPEVGREKDKTKNTTHRKPDKKTYDAEYVVDIPGLSPAQCKERAVRMADEIHKHELNVTFKVPISTNYDMDSVIYIDNIPIPAKQFFIPKTIVFDFDVNQGGQASFTCVNHVLPVKGSG